MLGFGGKDLSPILEQCSTLSSLGTPGVVTGSAGAGRPRHFHQITVMNQFWGLVYFFLDWLLRRLLHGKTTSTIV